MTNLTNRYTFIMNQCDGSVVSLSGNKEMLDDVIEDFKMWLLGCGYGHTLVDQIVRCEEG